MVRPTLRSIAACLITAVPLAAQDDQDVAMLQAGKEILEQARPLPPGHTFESYFAVQQGPDQALGYVVTTLELATDKESKVPFYRYTSDTVATIPNGARADMSVRGKLRLNFEPLEIDVRRAVMKPGGGKQAYVQHAKLNDKKVTLNFQTASNKGGRELERPKAPFIYGIETLVQRIPIRIHEIFSIREFNVATGTAGRLIFTVDEWSDGTPSLVVGEPGGSIVYQFWFSNDGELLRWGEPSHPVVFIRTSKKRVEELKAQFGPPAVTAD